MPTATAKKVAASGFGSTPAGRRAVTHAPKHAAPAPAPSSVQRVTGRPTARKAPARATAPGGPKPASATRGPSSRRPAPNVNARAAGRSADYRAPKISGPLSRNRKVRLGSRRAQHILVGELIAVLVIIVLDDVMDVGAVVNLPVQATALAGLFLVLALLSASGRSGERIAVGFGGLVVLGVAVQRWPMFTAMRSAATIAYGKAYKGQAAIQAPGPPVVDPAPPPNARLGGTL